MQPFSKDQLNRQTFMGSLRQEFHPTRLIPSLTAALITGTIEVIYAVSFAAPIFSGDLAPYISTGIGLSLFTCMTVSLILAIGSSSPGIVSGVQEVPAIVMAGHVSNDRRSLFCWLNSRNLADGYGGTCPHFRFDWHLLLSVRSILSLAT